MRTRISALVASIILAFTAGISSAGAAARPRHHHHHPHRRHARLRLPATYAAWAHVALCESGGWRVLGAAYPDPFGITATNWAWMGAGPMPVGAMTLAARIQAVRVADRFVARLGASIPDQGGCWAW